MARLADHLVDLDNPNPFPGLLALERRTGRSVQLRLGGNESLDAPLTSLRQLYGDAFCHHARLYGDPSGERLRERLAQSGGFDPNELCIDSGADAVIALCVRALCSPGDTAVTSAGTYPTFGYFARASGCHLIEVPYEDHDGILSVSPDTLLETARRARAKVIYLANPDNPTGSWLPLERIEALAAQLPEDCTLLLDEAYLEFCPALAAGSERSIPGCIRIRSLSKAHALAGLRIGYALAEKNLLDGVAKARIHYSVGGLAQHAAQLALADADHAEAIRTHNALLRETLSERLRAAGYRVLPSGTNFVSLLLPTEKEARQLQEQLLTFQVAVHRPQHPSLNNLIRVTLCEAALQEWLLDIFLRARRCNHA